MEKLKFKTNINCSGCIATFTPFIEGKAGVNAWNVDTSTPDKVLTVEGELSQEEVVACSHLRRHLNSRQRGYTSAIFSGSPHFGIACSPGNPCGRKLHHRIHDSDQ